MRCTGRLAACALLASLLCYAHASSSVLFVDNTRGSYLNKGADAVSIDSGAFSSLVSSVLGLLPPGQVDTLASEAVVKPSLKKSRANMVFNVAGLSQAELQELFGEKQIREVQVQGQDTQALMFDSLAAIATSNPSVSFVMLDDQGLQGCAGNCIDEHMAGAAGCMNAQHADSALTFSSGANLDLSSLSDKMFAVEAASLYAGLQALQQQAPEQESDLHMLETTLVSLHALEAAHGDESEVVKAAKDALKNLLKWTVEKLDAKYDGDVTYQVAGIAKASGKTTVQEIMGWKQESRRRLMEGTPMAVAASSSSQYPPANQTLAAQMFTAKACGYGGFILILYFALAGVWCMVYMPMKQDTMLFGAKKEN